MVFEYKIDSLDNCKRAQKQRLIDNEELAWGQHQMLERAKTSSKQIESMSTEVMKELESQSGQLRGIKAKVNDIDQNIDRSNNLINRMMRRENRNKILISTFALSLLIVFCLIMYFKFN